jgi:hypothetical protein
MKRLIVFGVLFLLAFSFVSAEATQVQISCLSDSDGEDYFNKGFVDLETKLQEDSCSGKYVNEQLCVDGIWETKKYLCPSGCRDGVCGEDCAEEGEEVYLDSALQDQGPSVCCDANSGIRPKINLVRGECASPFSNYPDWVIGACDLDWDETCGDGVCDDAENSCNCLADCEEGWTCADSDGGKNYYVKGTVRGKDDSSERVYVDECCVGSNCDSHYGGDSLSEGVCVESDKGFYMDSVIYECPNGCEDGVCVEVGDDDEEIDSGRGDEKECSGGCLLDEKCYDYGFRKGFNYCSDVGGDFVEQKSGEEICDNNFECDSNVCVDGECVSAGLMKRILNWFRRLFG